MDINSLKEKEFDAWLSEPYFNGQPNGVHLNTRTMECCKVAFSAGWDACQKAKELACEN
jgi:hypothetical protein